MYILEVFSYKNWIQFRGKVKKVLRLNNNIEWVFRNKVKLLFNQLIMPKKSARENVQRCKKYYP